MMLNEDEVENSNESDNEELDNSHAQGFIKMMLNEDEVENSNESDNEELGYSHAQGDSDEITPAEFQHDAVSALNLCQTRKATKLVIFDLEYKLQNNDQYDIGGTYNKDNPDLWFFCTTSMGPKVRILNIFVCQRNKGTYKISISDIPSTVQLSTLEKFPNYLSIDKFKTKIFKSSENDKCHYITSFCFKLDDLENLKKISVCIPIQIEHDPKCPIDSDILKKIKIDHFISVIFKRNENTDFILESNTGKKYDVHKIVLAAQSNVLKEIIRNSKSNTSVFDISDDEMEALLEFLYTGKVKSFLDENCFKLIDIAYKFNLEKLIILLKLEIVKNINIKNAVEIAVITERYKLDSIQKDVFEFIKKNPEVLETEGWTNLNDVALTKKLFKKIYFDTI